MLVPTQIWRYVGWVFPPFSSSAHALAPALLCALFHNLPVSISTSRPSLSLPSHPGHFCQFHFPGTGFFLRKTTKANSQWVDRTKPNLPILEFRLQTKRPSQFYSHFLNTVLLSLHYFTPCSPAHLFTTHFLLPSSWVPSVGRGMHLLVRSLLSATLELSATLTIRTFIVGPEAIWFLIPSGPGPLASQYSF